MVVVDYSFDSINRSAPSNLSLNEAGNGSKCLCSIRHIIAFEEMKDTYVVIPSPQCGSSGFSDPSVLRALPMENT